MPTAIEFGRFRIPPHRPEVLAECHPRELGGRAFARRAGWSCVACAPDRRKQLRGQLRVDPCCSILEPTAVIGRVFNFP